jgi:hypothetical protein
MRLAAAALAALAIISPCRALDFLTDGQGGYLTDAIGGRIFQTSFTQHSVILLSTWPTIGLTISGVGEVLEDLSGIRVVGFAYLDGSTISKIEIMTVDSTPTVKLLQTCDQDTFGRVPPNISRCEYTIPAASMHPGSNDVWVIATTAAGQRYAATTKMSPP